MKSIAAVCRPPEERGAPIPAIALALERELADLGVDPGRLIVEVTETAAVADLDAARRICETLRALGVEFALDDFGAGYGSFHYGHPRPARG